MKKHTTVLRCLTGVTLATVASAAMAQEASDAQVLTDILTNGAGALTSAGDDSSEALADFAGRLSTATADSLQSGSAGAGNATALAAEGLAETLSDGNPEDIQRAINTLVDSIRLSIEDGANDGSNATQIFAEEEIAILSRALARATQPDDNGGGDDPDPPPDDGGPGNDPGNDPGDGDPDTPPDDGVPEDPPGDEDPGGMPGDDAPGNDDPDDDDGRNDSADREGDSNEEIVRRLSEQCIESTATDARTTVLPWHEPRFTDALIGRGNLRTGDCRTPTASQLDGLQLRDL